MIEGNELKKIVDELEKELERYKRLIDSVSDYIYTVKIEKEVAVETIHEPGCVVVTGYTSKEFEADPFLWYRMIHEEDRSPVMGQISKLLAGTKVPSLEHRIINKDGSIRWVRNTATLRHDEKGNLIAYDGLIEDITGRKRMEEDLRQKLDDLERMNKLLVDRELRTKELKDENDSLKKKIEELGKK